jgi:ribose transport system permease protein
LTDTTTKRAAHRWAADYSMLLVLLLLCGYFSIVTLEEQHPTGTAAVQALDRRLSREFARGSRVLIVVRETSADVAFAEALRQSLSQRGLVVVATVQGQPSDARQALEKVVASGGDLNVIACNQATAAWAVWDDLAAKYPSLAHVKIVQPDNYHWPNFLKADNLLNVANQIAVIAIIAIGMTMVIITAGIDLSVGSLIALSAVVATLLIRQWAGAEQATIAGMVGCCLIGIGLCAVIGGFSGTIIACCGVPPFIATLAMMLVASGLAFVFAKGQSIYQVPETFVGLGRGSLWGVPNAVWLMGGLYLAAHVVMTRMTLGRYVYAIGGNPEAARLSGVPVRAVLVLVYTLCGALAGLGGIVMASQLKSGAPTYGQMYELYVIAAVVVGGTSLAGGEGKVGGTLIGAFIIAVIQNGMNLTGVESYTQKVVLGLVILGAVLFDTLKRRFPLGRHGG